MIGFSGNLEIFVLGSNSSGEELKHPWGKTSRYQTAINAESGWTEMASLTGTTKFYEVKWILTYLILIPTLGSMTIGAQHSKIVIGPCSLPMVGVTTNFCCRTQNVPPTATIYFYMYQHFIYDDDVVATIKQPGCVTSSPFEVNVTCKQENDEFVYSLMYPAMDIRNAIGTWGCRYYGNESTYTLNIYQVLTEHKQYRIVHPGDNAVLSWIISPRSDLNLKVISPDGLPLLKVFQNVVTFVADKVQFVGNLPNGDVSIQLENIMEKDNGTYTCSTTNSGNIGITVVVLKKPLTPVISLKTGSVIKSGYKVEGKIICTSSSQSAAPMYYYTLLQYSWFVMNSQASYRTSFSWNQLLLTDVDCRMDNLPPVYCAAKEQDAISDKSEPFYPYDLCNVTPLPSPEKELYQRITTLTGIMAAFIAAFVVTLIISLVFGRKIVKKGLGKFCKCCHFCCKDGSSLGYEHLNDRSGELDDRSCYENDAVHQSGNDQIAQEQPGQAGQQGDENNPSNNIPPQRIDDNVFDPQPGFVEIAQEETIGANHQQCDDNPSMNRPPSPYGAASPGDVCVPPSLAMPQEFDHDLQTAIEEIALQESREVNYPLSDNNPSRNRQHDAQRGPSTGGFRAQPQRQAQSVPKEFDHDLQTAIEEIALQESREANYSLSDNNPSRNRQHDAQRGPSTGAFRAQPQRQAQSVPKEFDHDLQTAVEEIALQEPREANYPLSDNNPSRNRQHDAQRVPSTGGFRAQPQRQAQSVHQHNAPRTASPGDAAFQLLMEVESKLEEFNQSLGEQALQIVIDRDNIVNNLICYYTDLVVPQSRVQVKMIGEDGMDAGGVMSDMYTTFWNKAKEQFFIGCEAVVPYLPAHKMVEEENFRVLGRILSHSVALMKTIPVPLCTSTIIVMIYDTLQVPVKTLLNDFLLFIASDDKDLVSKALANFSSLSSEELGKLQSIFSGYDYAGVIKESNFEYHLVQLASNEICRKPKRLCDLMRAGIPPTHMNVFWSLLHPDHFSILYVVQKPTAMAIIARLQIDRDSRYLSSSQQRAFQYLKDFLRELSTEELETFVQFVTGKRCTPREPIIISFSSLRGYQRMPRAHTCSNLLELPATYEDYDAFKNEFKHLLASDEAMIMTLE